jgi:hypothetical protein
VEAAKTAAGDAVKKEEIADYKRKPVSCFSKSARERKERGREERERKREERE